MPNKFLHLFLLISILTTSIHALKNAIRGKKCTQNQVVNKLTVYEDGAIEAECAPLPCGSTDACAEDVSSCRAPSEVFSGMKWAKNGQSLLLRCCTIQANNKAYIGTDLVTLGSYYTGGVVPEKDMLGSSGVEYDFVANARTEQGGVRVWVYRIVCSAPHDSASKQPKQPQPTQNGPKESAAVGEEEEPKFSENQDANAESQPSPAVAVAASAVEEEQLAAQNPLQYRPRRSRQQAAESPVNRVL